jgi:hypothetical protein
MRSPRGPARSVVEFAWTMVPPGSRCAFGSGTELDGVAATAAPGSEGVTTTPVPELTVAPVPLLTAPAGRLLPLLIVPEPDIPAAGAAGDGELALPAGPAPMVAVPAPLLPVCGPPVSPLDAPLPDWANTGEARAAARAATPRKAFDFMLFLSR